MEQISTTFVPPAPLTDPRLPETMAELAATLVGWHLDIAREPGSHGEEGAFRGIMRIFSPR